MKKLILLGIAAVGISCIIDYAEKPLTPEEREKKVQSKILKKQKELEDKCNELLDKRRIDLTIRESEFFKNNCEN